MKIAFYRPANLPHSSRIYTENVTAHLSKLGHTVMPFSGKKLPKPADIYWQPSAGRDGPNVIFKKTPAPVVVTFHGAANLALPLSLCFGSGIKDRWRGYKSRLVTYYQWRSCHRLCDAVITVSDYAKQEAMKHLGLHADLIESIYHGVDHTVFYPAEIPNNAAPYLLHVSSYQPKKNLDRIIAAFLKITDQPKPCLKIVAPGYPLADHHEEIELISGHLDHRQIAMLYQNALGFVFPSLHETFGMPIIEAMACGCPVITSNHPGCAETAGDAALIVNPYSVEEIATAMKKIIFDSSLRQSLRYQGIKRARQFTWQKSAEEHLAVFQKIKVS